MTEDKVLKIEKVNDNQIKCILTREDLDERKISFSELTFGSSQANELLRDMMQQASVEVGFEADDKPLMVEIVPMQTGLIVFVITKMSGADKAEDALISGENTDIQEDITDDEAENDEDEDNNGSGRTMEIKITQQSGAPIPLEPMMRSLHDLFREMMGSGSSQSRNESKEPVNYSEEGSRLFLFDDMDALLGAAAMGDIGKHFPDTDEKYKGADSAVLMKEVGRMLAEAGFRVGNIDATIIAQKPKMAPHIESMRERIAEVLGIDISRINVKATTEEGLGFTGEGLGISCQAIALLEE